MTPKVSVFDETKEEETNVIGGTDNLYAAIDKEDISRGGLYISHPGILAGRHRQTSFSLLFHDTLSVRTLDSKLFHQLFRSFCYCNTFPSVATKKYVL